MNKTFNSSESSIDPIYKYNPLNHSLNYNLIKKFINASDISVQLIIKKIIKNTLHISFEEFIISFKFVISKFINFMKITKSSNKKIKNRPIFIFIDKTKNNYKTKSNYWLYVLFKSFIKNFEIIKISSFNDPKLKVNDFILFIDDCIYSGTQIANSITFNSMIFTENKLKFNICILVPFITNIGKINIEKSMRLNTTLDQSIFNIIYYKLIYINISNILTDIEINTIETFYNKFEKFSNKYLIYFDHKLADNISTIPLFYSGLVPCIYNKNILSNPTFQTLDINKLLFIPFINNCQNIRNFNSNIPECPYPIYKEIGFINFINKIKKNIRKPLSVTQEKKLKSYSLKTI